MNSRKSLTFMHFSIGFSLIIGMLFTLTDSTPPSQKSETNLSEELSHYDGLPTDFMEMTLQSNVKIIPGDYNGDGKTDIALVRQSPGWSTIPIAFSGREGTWAITNKPIGDMKGWAATSGVKIVPGDYNGDGKTDIALVRQTPGWATAPIAFANGDGSWTITNKKIGDMKDWAATSGVKIVPGDYNGDGKTDIALVRQASGWATAPIAFANGDGTWTITNKKIGDMKDWAATSGVQIVPGDYNGDGKMDIALIRQTPGWATAPIAFANGDGSWTITNKPIGDMKGWAATSGVQIIPGDYNRDGKTDIALVRQTPGWATAPVALAKGDGTWTIMNKPIGDMKGWAATSGVQIIPGDFNGDGRADIALANQKPGWSSIPIAFGGREGEWRIVNNKSGDMNVWLATPN